MAFPSSIPSYAGFTATHTLAVDQHGEQHNQEQADIVGIATKIGTGSSTPTSGVALVGNGVGTSIWGQIPLTTGVSGILPVNSGGTGTGTSTGTGSVVLNSAPTTNNETATNLTSTKLNNSSGLTNTGGATTDTQTITGNATVGGTLGVTGASTLASLILNGSLTGTGLGSQVQSQANAGTAGGTMYYINLGGIKALWCHSANQTSGATPLNYTFTLPTFFTTIRVAQATCTDMVSQAYQCPSIGSYTTTAVGVYVTSPSGAGTSAIDLFLIGT